MTVLCRSRTEYIRPTFTATTLSKHGRRCGGHIIILLGATRCNIIITIMIIMIIVARKRDGRCGCPGDGADGVVPRADLNFIWRAPSPSAIQWHSDRRYARIQHSATRRRWRRRRRLHWKIARSVPTGPLPTKGRGAGNRCVVSDATPPRLRRRRRRRRRTGPHGLGPGPEPGARAQGRSTVQAVPVPVRGPQAQVPKRTA